jgi:hypothetical protein
VEIRKVKTRANLTTHSKTREKKGCTKMTKHHDNFERHLVEVISGNKHSAEQIASLLGTAEAALETAKQDAALAAEHALNPTVSADPVAARNAADDAELRVGRILTLIGRLRTKLQERVRQDETEIWRSNWARLNMIGIP